ncbi:MAG: hypothetical protein NZ903_02515 [Candidatus Micrarchaeota archaeon]|nr:hypothetical protein [Candidatus Micrarchaeota archaeon]
MGFVDIIKGLIVAILVLTLMALLPVYIAMNSVQATLLNQQYYETQFEKIGIYTKLHNSLINGLVENTPSAFLDSYNITKDEMRSAFAKTITKEWVKGEINRNLRNIFWYLNDETKGVNISISLRGKIAEGFARLISEKTGIPSLMALTLIKDSKYIQEIPDPIDIETIAPGTKSALANLKENVMLFKTYHLYITIGIIAILAILFAIIRDIKEFTKVVGWPLLLTGIFLAASSFFVPSLLKEEISKIDLGQEIISPTNLIDMFSPIFGDVLFQSIILIALAVILIIVSFVYPKKSK